MFIVHEERDLFFDALVCVLSHVDFVFKQTFLKQLSPEDISASRFLKSKVVKNLCGEYVFVTFNRRNLLRQQSSISALQSVGFFSTNEASLTEMLSGSSPSITPPVTRDDMTQQSHQSEEKVEISVSPKLSKEKSKQSDDLLDELIDLHHVYGGTRDNDRRSLFSLSSSSSANGSFRKTFSVQNPSSCRSPSNAGAVAPIDSSKNCEANKSRRQSNGEVNAIRMGAYFTNRNKGRKYEECLQKRESKSNQADDADPEIRKQVRVGLDAPGRNRIPQRRGSASAILAQQTADFMLKSANRTHMEASAET